MPDGDRNKFGVSFAFQYTKIIEAKHRFKKLFESSIFLKKCTYQKVQSTVPLLLVVNYAELLSRAEFVLHKIISARLRTHFRTFHTNFPPASHFIKIPRPNIVIPNNSNLLQYKCGRTYGIISRTCFPGNITYNVCNFLSLCSVRKAMGGRQFDSPVKLLLFGVLVMASFFSARI